LTYYCTRTDDDMDTRQLLAKFNNKHFFSVAGNVAMSVFALVTVSLLIRFMSSAAELDSWFLFLTVFTLVETARAGFLTTATVKFCSGADKKRFDEVMGSAWYLGAGITTAIVVINIPFLVLSFYIENAAYAFSLKWVGLTALLSLPSVIANCSMQAEARFDRILYMRMVTQLSFLAMVVYLIFSDNLNLQTVLVANLLSHVATSIFLLARGWAEFSTLAKRSKKAIRELYDFGKFTVAGNVSSNLLRSSDVYIISFMFTGKASEGLVTMYNLALRLLEMIEIPLRSFVATAMPTLSADYNRGDRKGLIYTMQKYAGAVTYLLVPICVLGILLADVAVFIMKGKKVIGPEAANVLRIFLTFALLFPADRFIALSLDAIHKPNINLVKILIMLAVNVAGDFIGIAIFRNIYGPEASTNIYGVALATIFPTLVGVFVGYWALKKYEPFSLRQIYVVGFAEAKQMIRRILNRPSSVTS
jgi:O-antigen/teichoic acid export membrane protein